MGIADMKGKAKELMKNINRGGKIRLILISLLGMCFVLLYNFMEIEIELVKMLIAFIVLFFDVILGYASIYLLGLIDKISIKKSIMIAITNIIICLLLFIIALILIIPFAIYMLKHDTLNIVAIAILVLCSIAILTISIIVICRLSFYYIIYIIEDLSIMKSLLKSWQLTRGEVLGIVLFNVSFLQWFILKGITFNLASYYVVPYYNASYYNYYTCLLNFDVDNIEH